jgi:hypothetical protein
MASSPVLAPTDPNDSVFRRVQQRSQQQETDFINLSLLKSQVVIEDISRTRMLPNEHHMAALEGPVSAFSTATASQAQFFFAQGSPVRNKVPEIGQETGAERVF